MELFEEKDFTKTIELFNQWHLGAFVIEKIVAQLLEDANTKILTHKGDTSEYSNADR